MTISNKTTRKQFRITVVFKFTETDNIKKEIHNYISIFLQYHYQVYKFKLSAVAELNWHEVRKVT